MLRHLFMTSPPEPSRVLPRRLQSLANDVIRPLYSYVIPHRTPRRHEVELFCTCPYPLFTLCTPTTSPYDVTDKDQNISSETSTEISTNTAEHEGSHVVGEFPIKAELLTLKKINNKLEASSNMIMNKEDYAERQSKRKRITKKDQNAVSGNISASTNSSSKTLHSLLSSNGRERLAVKPQEELQEEQRSEEEQEESSNRSFQVKARGVRRLRWSRTLLHPWELWRKQHTTYMHTIHPNVVPGRPACYRCDICDEFQFNNKNSLISPLGSCSKTVSSVTNKKFNLQEESNGGYDSEKENTRANFNDEERESSSVTRVSDYRVGRLIEPQSPRESSVAAMMNTSNEEEHAKNMADIAQLRYLDPFNVEVYHWPPLTSLVFNFMRQFEAQLQRCNTDVYELSKRVKYVALNSVRNARYFESWVKQERKRRFHLMQTNSTSDKIKYYAHGVHVLERASYAVRFAVAVYGLPYELGYFNSVQGMLKSQAEPHCRYVYATAQEQMNSMKRMLQGNVLHSQEYEFALSQYSKNFDEASFAVVIDHAARKVIVAFRGTLTLSDAVMDIMEGYVNVKLCKSPLEANTPSHEPEQESKENNETKSENSSPLHTRIPIGFFNSVQNAALTLVPALNAILTEHKDYVLYITGHSLGATQASLFHLLYCTQSITVTVVNDPKKAALMPSEKQKKSANDEKEKKEEESLQEKEGEENKCKSNVSKYETGVSVMSKNNTNDGFARSTTSSAITNALAKVKCKKVHTFAFAPAPMMELNIIPQLQHLLEQEQTETLCANSLNSFVYGQDPVSRLEIRSLLNMFTPSYYAKNNTTTKSVSAANTTEKANSQETTNVEGKEQHFSNITKTDTIVDSENKKDTIKGGSFSNDKEDSATSKNMSFGVSDARVPTLGIPGHLYCIPHTSRRCFFPVDVQTQWRKKLILTPYAMVHHFPVHYLRAVNKLRMHYSNQLNALRAIEQKE